MNLVDRLVSDPNSSFKAEDAAELEKLPPEVLQRMAIGLQPQVVTNAESSREDDLRSDLEACQKDILSLLSAEADIRRDLESYGNVAPSVIAQFVPVMNAAASPEPLSEESVMDFIKNSQSMTGQVLREALQARERGRKKAIEIIVTNSHGVFTEEELRRKFTAELDKMADFVQQSRQVPAETTVFNWEGVGLADQSINQSMVGGNYGTPLEMPSTFK